MAICGSCKQEGQSVEHVRECYAAKRTAVATVEVTGLAKKYVEQRDFRPMALTVPDSKYALVQDGVVTFYEVRTGTKKWAGFQFVDRLVGAPGDWQKYPVKGSSKTAVLQELNTDPKAAAIAFSKHFTVCAVCGSPLSDPESMARGLGPICEKRF